MSRIHTDLLLLTIAIGLTGCGAIPILMGRIRLKGEQDAIPTPRPTADMAAGMHDWPCWRGTAGDGRSTVTGIRTNWAGGLKQLWQVDFLCQDRKTGATWSAPVIRGERLIAIGRSTDSDLIFCLSAITGELIWTNSYAAGKAGSHGSGARATPCIDGDRVFSLGRYGDLVCYQLADGKLLWRTTLTAHGGEAPRWGHASSPLVVGDNVIVQLGGTAFAAAFNKQTGTLAWKSAPGDAGYAAPTVTIGESPSILVFHATGISCLEPAAGRTRWTVPWVTKYGVNATTPLVLDSRVYITSGYSTGGEMLDISGTEPVVAWRNETIAAQHSDPYIVDGCLYGFAGSSHQNKGPLACVNADTGATRWSTSELGWGTMVYVDGYLLTLNIEGDLFLLKPDPAKPNIVATMPGAMEASGVPTWTTPVIANGKLYLRHLQHLKCYDLMP